MIRCHAARSPRRIGEHDHRGLQSLGPVHRHHPHRIVGRIRIALKVKLIILDPGQKPLQRRGMGIFKGQGLGQQCFDLIPGFLPQSRQQLCPTAKLPRQDRLQKLMWRHQVGVAQDVAQPVGCGSGLRARHCPQTTPERNATPAVIGCGEQRLLIPTKERGGQQAGQRQVVVGLQGEADQRQAILHRNRGRQPQPVHTGDRDLLRVQIGNERSDKFSARSNQHQYILWSHPPPTRQPHRRIIDPLPDLPGQPPRQHLHLPRQPFGLAIRIAKATSIGQHGRPQRHLRCRIAGATNPVWLRLHIQSQRVKTKIGDHSVNHL